jgi:hypothetical protein
MSAEEKLTDLLLNQQMDEVAEDGTLPICAGIFFVGVVVMCIGAAADPTSWSKETLVAGAIIAFTAAGLAARSCKPESANAMTNLKWCRWAMLAGYSLLFCAASLAVAAVLTAWAIAAVATGVYLLAFAHYAYRKVLPWWGAILVIGVSLGQMLGIMFLLVGFDLGVHYSAIRHGPQELSTEQLIRDGWGDNRYVRLTGFRACDPDKIAAEDYYLDYFGRLRSEGWIPVVAANGKHPEPAAVPRKIQLVLYVWGSVDEDKPYEGIITNGRHPGLGMSWKPMTEKAKAQLLKYGPETDLDSMIVLRREYGTVGVASVFGTLGGGGLGLILSVVGSMLLFRWAGRIAAEKKAAAPTVQPAPNATASDNPASAAESCPRPNP